MTRLEIAGITEKDIRKAREGLYSFLGCNREGGNYYCKGGIACASFINSGYTAEYYCSGCKDLLFLFDDEIREEYF